MAYDNIDDTLSYDMLRADATKSRPLPTESRSLLLMSADEFYAWLRENNAKVRKDRKRGR